MNYDKVVPALFVERKNRFIALCDLSGQLIRVHVRNTGRCAELLVPGTRVYLEPALEHSARATGWSLVSVEKDGRIFNVDSQMPNRVFREAVETKLLNLDKIGAVSEVKGEIGFGESRLDFWLKGSAGQAFAEVKGVTLETDGIARFPDAPTERGIKHLNTLVSAVEQGYSAYAVFVLQFSGASRFEANWETHAEFGRALRRARECGVEVIAFECRTSPGEIYFRRTIDVEI